jgi:hypothetical protein
MGVMEEIKQMQKEGRSDSEIANSLRRRGFSDRDVADKISQAKIKEAVTSPPNAETIPSQFPGQSPINSTQEINSQPQFPEAPSPQFEQPTEYSYQAQAEYAGMQPSMITQEQQNGAYPPEQQIMQQGYENYPAQDYGTANYGYDPYSQYQSYQETVSSDIITEISEQVVADKLATIQDRLEKAIDFKTIADAKITSLNERLKRIEEILDKLQLSILQRIGDYVTDVGDIKKEMRENQESFKALLPKLREIHESKHPAHHEQPSHPVHHEHQTHPHSKKHKHVP